MKYVVMDLEMCILPKSLRCESYRWKQETIQIGAVLLNESYEIIDSFSTYVCPQFGALDPFITQLTGIRQEHIVHAPVFADAMNAFLAWIPDEEVICVSWSTSDEKQIRHEMEAKKFSDKRLEDILDDWIDCQKIFGNKMDSRRAYSLEEAMIASDVYQKGRAHDGLTDAYNTALLFAKLETNPDYDLNSVYKAARDENIEHIGTSLKDVFAGLTLQTAI